jgi:hypothetical protein
MFPRRVAVVVLALVAVPGAAAAGPVAFRLSGEVDVQPGSPAAAASLLVTAPTGDILFDPNAPTRVGVVTVAPPVLPSDPANAPDQGGGTYYDSAYLRLGLHVTDVASGEQAEVWLPGRAHVEWWYGGGNEWNGSGYIWFDTHPQSITLGGQLYTIWSPEIVQGADVSVNVWVGPDAPVNPFPEPGTLVLAGVGLAPLGLRFVRRRR